MEGIDRFSLFGPFGRRFCELRLLLSKQKSGGVRYCQGAVYGVTGQ